MSVHVVGSFTLAEINIAADLAVTITAPLLAEVDGMLFGAFGLGGLQADLSGQLSAALQAQLAIALSIGNPLLTIQAALSGIGQIGANLTAALTLGLPPIELTASLSATAALVATVGAKLAGLQALISAAVSLKLPVVDFVAGLIGNLTAGPIVLCSWGFTAPPDTLQNTGADISSLFSSGVGGLVSTDAVYGLLLVTKSPSASAAISATLKVS